jgi:hypothetical protein
MSSESSSDSQNKSPERDRLPFEPAKNRKPSQKKAVAKPKAATVEATKETTKSDRTVSKDDRSAAVASNDMAIPEVVSRRMIGRMAFFSGIPTFFGMSTFFVSYFLITKANIELPHYAVVLISLGFFGLGIVGLSYGVLSSSWDEAVPGSKLGWSEFATNLGRMTSAWRSQKKS